MNAKCGVRPGAVPMPPTGESASPQVCAPGQGVQPRTKGMEPGHLPSDREWGRRGSCRMAHKGQPRESDYKQNRN